MYKNKFVQIIGTYYLRNCYSCKVKFKYYNYVIII